MNAQPVGPLAASSAVQHAVPIAGPFTAASELLGQPSLVSFAYDQIQHGHFPLNLWKRLSAQTIREADPELFDYGDPQGELSLRRLICAHVRQYRGVQCDPAQMIITSGTQHSAWIIALLLRADMLPLGVEAAMHPGLRQIWDPFFPELVPLPIEEDGVSCQSLTQTASLCGVYVTPSHQFPYGSILSAAKRTQLLQWAIDRNAWIIEDDYDSEFIYSGQPLPALQGMDPGERVLYMGTFSKALAPALRLSYLILPQPLLAQYKQWFPHLDNTVSRLTQITLARFMQEGHLERHIRRMRTRYDAVRKALLASIAQHFPKAVRITGSASGLHVRLVVKSSLSFEELVQRSAAAGISIRPMADFHLSAATCEFFPQDGHSFILGYGGLTVNQVEEGICRLAKAWGPAQFASKFGSSNCFF